MPTLPTAYPGPALLAALADGNGDGIGRTPLLATRLQALSLSFMVRLVGTDPLAPGSGRGPGVDLSLLFLG